MFGLFKGIQSRRIVVVLLVLLLVCGTVSYSLKAASSLPIYSVPLGGVTGATNNTVLAYGRFVLVAPYWPSKGVADNGDLDISQLDNNLIYVLDTKKSDSTPVSKILTAWDAKLDSAKTVYFPTRVVFDPATSNVYVRGTRFEEKDGETIPIDVIAYVKLNLDDSGKAVFDTTVVPIDIQGVNAPYTGNAPLDFAFGAKGELMVFTNGASIFSYNLEHGYLYGVGIVPESEYTENDTISFLDVDPETNVVSVCWNKNTASKDSVVSSEISFYRLNDNGTFEILKRVYAEQLPAGVSLTSGSNIVIASDADSELALFATNDGSLCSVDLRSDGVQATVKHMYSFPELARVSIKDTTPLLTQYGIAKRTIGIVKPGFTTQISRPSNGRKGRISRPSNMHINAGVASVVAIAKLGKKNKVTSVRTFSDEFAGEGGLSNLVSGDAQWLVSTYSGRLYSVGIPTDLKDSSLELIGLMGSRVDRIDYYADRSDVVAINSLELDPDGLRLSSPGSLVVGRISTGIQANAVLQALLPTVSLVGRPSPFIRRPCNIRR
ncbi:MAG TPA: hypothetical protein VKN18_23120 [Blastocatellia bacterium]|nr:hypothetical protein [Blastocatellia bacterium]